MLGRIIFSEDRRIRLEEERIFELRLCTLRMPVRRRGLERRLDKGALRLVRAGVTRILTSADFPHWPALERRGLRAVDTGPLRTALAPKWVLSTLRHAGVEPRRAVVALRGVRETWPMERTAAALCPLVRSLTVDVPGGGALAVRLRREFGLPVLPPEAASPDLTVTFSPDAELPGVQFSLPDAVLPDRCDRLPLLCALWEAGRISLEEIQISSSREKDEREKVYLDRVDETTYNI